MHYERIATAPVKVTATGVSRAVSLAAMDLFVLGAAWVSADRLGHWGWSSSGLCALLAGWAVVLAVAVWSHMRHGSRIPAVEALGGLAVLGLTVWVWPPSDAGVDEVVYGLGLAAMVLTGWRWWCNRAAAGGQEPVAEPLRVLVVAAAALWVMSPMITDRFTGGTDARWYAYMLHDFIEQWRAHGPPVFLGQGELVWVGAVHPFRSAPVYMHVAGLWDWLTFQTLGTGALQHLTAITAALAGALGVYAAGVKLASRHRWESMAVAVLYVTSPAVLMPLYVSDAYMTYLAAAAFVWVFYGNVRLLSDGCGWSLLAAGLSVAWMSHPPTAMQASVLSACLQLGGLALRADSKIDWRGPLGAAGLFGLLSLYYFTGMSELPRPAERGLAAELAQVLALVMGWCVSARVLLQGRDRGLLLLLLPAAVVLWLTCRIWLGWMVVTVVLLVLVGAVGRRWPRWAGAGHVPLVLLGAVLVGALAMDGALRVGWIEAGTYPDRSRQLWGNLWSDNYFKALSPHLLTEGDFQPGWGLWLAGLAAGLAACRRGALATQLVFGAIVLMSAVLLPWPRVSEFMLEYLPHDLVAMTGLTMELRVMPVFAALLVAGGLLALRGSQRAAGPSVRWTVGLLLLLATGAGLWQSRYFLQRGHLITAPSTVVSKDWRSENAPMDRFVYDLLPIPSYFSHGKMDPRLEVRLLDDRGNLIYGAPQMIEAMEAASHEIVGLNTHPIPDHPEWLQLEPRITLQPGEHRVLRFVFDPARHYSGLMVLTSPQGYREYALPESGMRRSFGTGPEHSRVISLWNSGTEPEQYGIQFLMRPGNDLAGGMHFATVTMSAFKPELALIEVESLNPWRVRTRLPWSGQLETPRVFLPGYEVRVDGRRLGPSRISASPDRLLQIAMPPGEHEVEVKYTGTWKLRFAGVISLIAWLVWFGVLLWGRRARSGRPDGF